MRCLQLPMAHLKPFSSLCLHVFVLSSLSFTQGFETAVLNVGKEIEGETLPLQLGQQRLYKIVGLKQSSWYEVKISYPASIPAAFHIELKRDPLELWSNKNRRLLNTEKLIFKADSNEPVYIHVTVEAAGVVAQPHVQERELVLFNIVCDELMLGIPIYAWWVVIAAVSCLLLAALSPCILPLHRMQGECQNVKDEDSAKIS